MVFRLIIVHFLIMDSQTPNPYSFLAGAYSPWCIARRCDFRQQCPTFSFSCFFSHPSPFLLLILIPSLTTPPLATSFIAPSLRFLLPTYFDCGASSLYPLRHHTSVHDDPKNTRSQHGSITNSWLNHKNKKKQTNPRIKLQKEQKKARRNFRCVGTNMVGGAWIYVCMAWGLMWMYWHGHLSRDE